MKRLASTLIVACVWQLQLTSPVVGESPPAEVGAVGDRVEQALQAAQADRDRPVVFRTDAIYVAAKGKAIRTVEGTRVTLNKRASIQRWPLAAMQDGLWRSSRAYEAARLGWLHDVLMLIGTTGVTPALKEQMLLSPKAEVGNELVAYNRLVVLERDLQLDVQEVVPVPLARPGDGPQPTDPKGAWSTSKHAQAAGVGFFKYQWASGAVVQMVVTSRSHQPPRTYGSFRLLPLANAGATGLPSELESAFVQAISSRFPTATSGQPASPVADAEAALDIEMLVNAYLDTHNYNSYNVAITYTMRDGGTGELMGRVDGFGFVRGEEKHRAKDIATIAAGCVVRKAF